MKSATAQAIALIVATIIGLQVLRFFQSRRKLSHVPGPKPASWLLGNLKEFFSHDAWDFQLKLYREYGGVARLDLMLGKQELVVTDPLALYHILVKDQDVYEEPDSVLLMFRLVFGPSLLSTLGERHAKQRKMLNPVFSIKHMRVLLPMGYSIAHRLSQVLEKEAAKGREHIDMMNWIGRTTLELIGQAGFGHSFNALDEEKPKDEYSEALGSLFPAITRIAILRQFLFLAKYGPASLRRRLLELVPSKNVKMMIDLTDTMERSSRKILEERKKALESGEDVLSDKGADILSSLMKENANAPEEELLGHMSTFILAGHDTTTSAVAQTLWILAQHPEEQSRLREEVTEARRENGDIDHDTLMALPYLDAVTRETLRLYSPSSMVVRVARKDIVLPVLWPIKSSDGRSELKEIQVPEGTGIFISILNANRSKAIWGEDAEEWKPGRWLKPPPKSVEDAHLPGVYSQMMTFAGGKRACIGFKLAEMELKMLLSTLLEKFVFEPGPELRWALGPTPIPIVKDTGAEGRLPLKVSLVHG